MLDLVYYGLIDGFNILELWIKINQFGIEEYEIIV